MDELENEVSGGDVISLGLKLAQIKYGFSRPDLFMLFGKTYPCSELANNVVLSSYALMFANVNSQLTLARNVFDAQIFGANDGPVVVGRCKAKSRAESIMIAYGVWIDSFQELNIQPKAVECIPLDGIHDMWLHFCITRDGKELLPEEFAGIILTKQLCEHPLFGPKFMEAFNMASDEASIAVQSAKNTLNA